MLPILNSILDHFYIDDMFWKEGSWYQCHFPGITIQNIYRVSLRKDRLLPLQHTRLPRQQRKIIWFLTDQHLNQGSLSIISGNPNNKDRVKSSSSLTHQSALGSSARGHYQSVWVLVLAGLIHTSSLPVCCLASIVIKSMYTQPEHL